MNNKLTFNIPANHVAHWKLTEDGKCEVEFLRFLYPGDAKLRRAREKVA